MANNDGKNDPKTKDPGKAGEHGADGAPAAGSNPAPQKPSAPETPPATAGSKSAKPSGQTLTVHLATAINDATKAEDHETRGALENFALLLGEVKARFRHVEDKLEGDAAAALKRIKELL